MTLFDQPAKENSSKELQKSVDDKKLSFNELMDSVYKDLQSSGICVLCNDNKTDSLECDECLERKVNSLFNREDMRDYKAKGEWRRFCSSDKGCRLSYKGVSNRSLYAYKCTITDCMGYRTTDIHNENRTHRVINMRRVTGGITDIFIVPLKKSRWLYLKIGKNE